jgi:hypothetical protein
MQPPVIALEELYHRNAPTEDQLTPWLQPGAIRYRLAVPTKDPGVTTICGDSDDDEYDNFYFPGFSKHELKKMREKSVQPIGIVSGRNSDEFSALDVDELVATESYPKLKALLAQLRKELGVKKRKMVRNFQELFSGHTSVSASKRKTRKK